MTCQCIDIAQGVRVTNLTMGSGDWMDYLYIRLSGEWSFASPMHLKLDPIHISPNMAIIIDNIFRCMQPPIFRCMQPHVHGTDPGLTSMVSCN